MSYALRKPFRLQSGGCKACRRDVHLMILNVVARHPRLRTFGYCNARIQPWLGRLDAAWKRLRGCFVLGCKAAMRLSRVLTGMVAQCARIITVLY